MYSVGDMVRVSGYASLNGETGTVTQVGTFATGTPRQIHIRFNDRSMGWFYVNELTLINNADLWR